MQLHSINDTVYWTYTICLLNCCSLTHAIVIYYIYYIRKMSFLNIIRNISKTQCVFLGFNRQGFQISKNLPSTMSLKSLPSMRPHFNVAFISLITPFRVQIPFHGVPQTLTFSFTIPSDVSLTITPSSVSQWYLSSISVVTVPVSLGPSSLFIWVTGRPLWAAKLTP